MNYSVLCTQKNQRLNHGFISGFSLLLLVLSLKRLYFAFKCGLNQFYGICAKSSLLTIKFDYGALKCNSAINQSVSVNSTPTSDWSVGVAHSSVCYEILGNEISTESVIGSMLNTASDLKTDSSSE